MRSEGEEDEEKHAAASSPKAIVTIIWTIKEDKGGNSMGPNDDCNDDETVFFVMKRNRTPKMAPCANMANNRMRRKEGSSIAN